MLTLKFTLNHTGQGINYKAKGNEDLKLLGQCFEFAQQVWLLGTGEYLNANTWVIIYNPETLKNSIIYAN